MIYDFIYKKENGWCEFFFLISLINKIKLNSVELYAEKSFGDIKIIFNSPIFTLFIAKMKRFLATKYFSLTLCRCYSNVRLKNAKPTKQIFQDMIKGDRAALAKAITLSESTREDHKEEANNLLEWTLEYLRNTKQTKTFRIGLTGSPGAGKSTLIETFGKKLTSMDHKVGVLAVDPSSAKTGGSLLGDRTRMIKLSNDPMAFIRPSPSSGTLGGVTRKTQEAIILMEGAGYNIILVETVGIGQSEFAVADMVDMFVLIIPPGSGDELQGIKKGVVEMADLVLINKADGELLPAARKVQTEYISALKLLRRPGDIWVPRVYPVSSLYDEGFEKVWWKMEQFQQKMIENGLYYTKRKAQYKAWMWNHLQENIMQTFLNNKRVKNEIEHFEQLVMTEHMSPSIAADKILKLFLRN